MKYNLTDFLKANEAVSIEKFLSVNNINNEKVAVAVNNNIISKKQWGLFHVGPSDILEVIKPTQGG
jgi:thiamine biosynthesis protein ThiS